VINRIDELALSRYWNDLQGPGSADPGQIEADTAAMVRRVQLLGSAPLPAAARERVRRKVMAEIDRIEQEPSMSSSVNGTVARPFAIERGVLPTIEQVRHRPIGRVSRGRSWAIAQLATAAILLITLFGIYRMHWDVRNPGGSNGHNGAVIPAATPSCGTTGSTTVAKTGTPVAIDVETASPAASSDTISFVWATSGVPNEEQLFSKLAIDPQCQIWVVDQLADRFLIFDLDGNLLDTWGSAGSGDGQFNMGGPDYFAYGGSIAFASDGGFYVSDVLNERVQQFDADRRFVRSWVVASGGDVEADVPTWIAVGPDGNVYVVVDTSSDIVQVYSPEGELLRKFGSSAPGPGHLSGAGAIAFDPAGNIWVLDPGDKSIVQFSPAGEPLLELQPSEIGSNPLALAIDAVGRFFVVSLDDNIVSVHDPDGTFLYSWGALGLRDGQFLNPLGIALDGNGGVYVSEMGTARVQKFLIQS
jgi:DNA-binding beta-propeller fold protein YncE